MPNDEIKVNVDTGVFSLKWALFFFSKHITYTHAHSSLNVDSVVNNAYTYTESNS
jgi:hypothetical protein